MEVQKQVGQERRKRKRRRRPRRGEENGTPRGRGWRNREQGPMVQLPSTQHVPRPPVVLPPGGEPPASATARRRRLSRPEMAALTDYLERMPEELLRNLYASMGGQPDRVPSRERMIQLAVRAIAQGSRLGTLVRQLHQRDRQALAILVQCGGVAHHEEFRQELQLSLGGNEREWLRVMANLGQRGLVAASETRDGHFFYLVPGPLVDQLVEHLHEDLALPGFEDEGVRAVDARPFCPPLDFSIVSLLTWIDRHPPRLTQRKEVYKAHKEEMDRFFAQVWAPDDELFRFHIDFIMQHGMVELRGDRLVANRSVVEEWLRLDPADQRDLYFAALDARLRFAEWVLRAVHEVGAWVPEQRLQALYRRWRRGEDWRERFHKGLWAPKRSAAREGYSFAPLVEIGMLELGRWGQEKFYRLTPRARHLLEPPEDEGFRQFYLTPNFEIMAPAGLSPLLFFRIGEIAELTACDRANTYKITEVSIEQALERGWRRDDILEFLRTYSQIGLPENVEQTLRGWMGQQGDVEFHELVLLTVHRAAVRRIEAERSLRPYLLHRFAPGMYAVDRTRLDELRAALEAAGLSVARRVRTYPDDPRQVEARRRLLDRVAEARQRREDLLAIDQAADTPPETLHLLPGTGEAREPARARRRRRDDLPPRCSPREAREICERAIALGQRLDMLYVRRDGQRKLVQVQPERIAVDPEGQQVLVARDTRNGSRLSWRIIQIERIATVAG